MLRTLPWRRFAAALATLLSLSACGWFSDDSGVFVDPRDDYLDAKEGPKLAVPEGLDEDNVGDPFPIPPTPEQTNANYFPDKPPLPDAIYGDDKAEEVRIQRIGERRWLVVPEEPTTVWPKLKQFFAENGVQVVNEAPSEGRLDTQWILVDAGTYRDVVRRLLQEFRSNDLDTVDRVLVRVERGLRDRTSEIHIRHLSQPAISVLAPPTIPDLTSLFDEPAAPVADAPLPIPAYQASLQPIRSTDENAEAELLKEVGAYIAAKVSEQLVSMIATNIQTEAKSVMERDVDGAPALRLNLDFERAWASIGQALENAEVEVLASERDSQQYRVKVDEVTFTGEEPGLFGRLFSFGDKSEEYNLQLVRVPNSISEAYWVTVLDAQQQPPSREMAQQLLVLVREYAG